MSCNITEIDIKSSKYKFGRNLTLILKGDRLWLHEENFIIEVLEKDAVDYIQLIIDSGNVLGTMYNAHPHIDYYPLDSLMNFLCMRNGHYNTGGLFGYFVEIGDLISVDKPIFMSKGSYPFDLLHVCRFLLQKNDKAANKTYKYYIGSLKLIEGERKYLNNIANLIHKNDRKITIIKKWDEEDKKYAGVIKNHIIIEFDNKVYFGIKDTESKKFFYIRKI